MEKSLSENIGNQIKTARLCRNMTQTELAHRLGTYQSSVAKIESGKGLPSLSFLQRIAESLDLEIKVEMQS